MIEEVKEKHQVKTNRIPTVGFCVVIVGVLLFLDQFTKALAVKHLPAGPIWLIENVFSLRYVENRGIGFGLFQGRVSLILICNVIILTLIIVLLWRLPINRRMMPIRVVLLFTVAGALGNIIDRIRLGYVVDFLSFDLIHFPVFNVADIFVTISIILLALLYLFYCKPGELEAAVRNRKAETKQDTEGAETKEQ